MFRYLVAAALIFLHVVPLYAENSNEYLAGYVKGAVYKAFDFEIEVIVRDGVVFITREAAESPQYNEINAEILTVSGVKDVRIGEDSDFQAVNYAKFLPSDTLFKPLLADPKWPRFAASYNYHTDYTYYRNAFDAVFGKDIPIIRLNSSSTHTIEIGVQAAAFITFDLGTPTFALLNTDYMIGVPLTVKWEKTALFARIYHLSSHLGDDYLAAEPDVENRDITYEKFDFIGEYRPEDWLRVYGGGGTMITKSPNSIKRLSYQFGVELYNKPDELFRPATFMAIDIKGFEETGYTPCYSVKVGAMFTEKLALSLDFYSGDSPHGQLYENRVTWFGTSLAFYL